MSHCDGRHVVVASTVEVVERLIGVACDVSLAERWRRLAAKLPAGSERGDTLRRCADELVATSQGPGRRRARPPAVGEDRSA